MEGAQAEAFPREREPFAGETALVEGRRPGAVEAVVFDEKAADAAPGGVVEKRRPKGRLPSGRRDRGRQRLRRMLGARSKTPQPGGAAREERSIEAPPGPRGVTSTAALGYARETEGDRARGSRRIATRLKLEVRRQAKLHPWARRRPLADSAPASRAYGPARVTTHDGAPGISRSLGCSCSWVGCRSR